MAETGFCICACADLLLWCCVSICGLTLFLTKLANQKLKRQSESGSADTCTPKRTYFFSIDKNLSSSQRNLLDNFLLLDNSVLKTYWIIRFEQYTL